MSDLLDYSAKIVDSGVDDGPTNRVTNELSEVGDGIAVVESFSHVVAFDTDDGLVCFDASAIFTGEAVVGALRHWRDERVAELVYTHGHIDHVGGSGAFAASAEAHGEARPHVLAQEHLADRFERYLATDGWNRAINARQFGGDATGDAGLGRGRFLHETVVAPDDVFAEEAVRDLGGVRFELHHARGETDDHLWAWVPEKKALCVGDFIIWNFPNAGNPQKVQRYPIEWAAALRQMEALDAELLLPAHGLPVAGAGRVKTILSETATVLEDLARDVLELMNQGADLDTIVHTVKVDPDLLSRPWLKPRYDDPEFAIHNVWRQFGGWWDGDAATLKPAPTAALATELATLAGGADRLAARALELSTSDADADLRLACHLAEMAGRAAPDDGGVHEIRAEVYGRRRKRETSLMAKGIYADAVRRSKLVTER